jgi:hypothetical protein
MDYDTFLEARRRLMARVVRAGYRRLRDDAELDEPELEDLVAEGEGPGLEFKASARFNLHTQQRDAEIEFMIVKTSPDSPTQLGALC